MGSRSRVPALRRHRRRHVAHRLPLSPRPAPLSRSATERKARRHDDVGV